MPIYEYRCPDCEHDFEELMKISDPTPPCPNCKSAGAERRVSRTSFVLKGGGWYKDLYSGPSNKPDGPAATESSGASSQGSDSKSSDSKSSDSKSSGSKSSDGKSSGSKSSDSKSSSKPSSSSSSSDA